MNTTDVFGIKAKRNDLSYIDRGGLDSTLTRLLSRNTHVAIRGESKVGKSWLRQTVLHDAITFQCRYTSKTIDIYKYALGEIGIELVVEKKTTSDWTFRATGKAELGIKILSTIEAEFEGERTTGREALTETFVKTYHDLSFVAKAIIASGKRLIIEDFHYLPESERRDLSSDLKAFWDFELFVVIIGVWSHQNLLINLNPDLTGRIEEISLSWSYDDLSSVLVKGEGYLNICFSKAVKDRLMSACYNNVGIMQQLALKTLDEHEIYTACKHHTAIDNIEKCDYAIMAYASQLEALYLRFSEIVSKGIRKRRDSTGIYAHTMAVILEEKDDSLLTGVSADAIFEKASHRQPRIQKSNLKSILEKIDEIQTDEENRGLVFSYNRGHEKVFVVDKQVLLFRKYRTISWPWESLIAEAPLATDE